MASKLPVEVVTHIMRYLSVSDRKEASLVNRTWYEASLDPIIQRDMIITLVAPFLSGDTVLGFGRRMNPNLIITQIDSSCNSIDVIEKSRDYLSRSLHNLSLKGMDLNETNFMLLLSSCNRLHRLDLSCCNGLFMSGTLLEKHSDLTTLLRCLDNVKDLNLSSIRFLSDATLNRILTVCPNVEKLALASAPFSFNTNAYLPKSSTKACVSGNMLTFQNFMDFLKRQASKLISLDFSRTVITNDSLSEIACTESLELKELILAGCRNLTDKGIKKLCRRQPSLVTLDVSGCTDLGDATLCAIEEHLSHMSMLKMKKCRQITDMSVKQLHHLSRLAHLDLSECYFVTSAGFIRGICSNIVSQITHLNLNCCSSVTDEFILALSKLQCSLTHLDLGSCFALTDVSVHAISNNFINLKFLRLAWCKEVSDNGLLGITEKDKSSGDQVHVQSGDSDHGQCRCTRRQQSSNVFTPSNPSEPLGSVAIPDLNTLTISCNGNSNKLYYISSLRSLDLTACTKVTDLSIACAIQFRELQILRLGMLHGLTDEGLRFIAQSNPSLEVLSVAGCPNITDKGIETILQKSNRLTSLDISNCGQISDRTLHMICRYCTRLKHLDVSFCPRITADTLEIVESSVKTLQSVTKRLIGAS